MAFIRQHLGQRASSPLDIERQACIHIQLATQKGYYDETLILRYQDTISLFSVA